VPTPPPFSGPPLNTLTPLNILDPNGFPVRNDNTSNLAFVGTGTGLSAPEQYTAYNRSDLADPTPIAPGETTLMRNTQTGLYCRLVPVPAGYSLKSTINAFAKRRTPPGRSQPVAGATASAKRGLRQFATPNCNTQGVVCDQTSPANAVVLTYTGTGLSYQGVPLVVSPVTKTLVLSGDPACTTPGGDKLTFPPATMGERQPLRALCQTVSVVWRSSGSCADCGDGRVGYTLCFPSGSGGEPIQ
jgi:hypothetical protein